MNIIDKCLDTIMCKVLWKQVGRKGEWWFQGKISRDKRSEVHCRRWEVEPPLSRKGLAFSSVRCKWGRVQKDTVVRMQSPVCRGLCFTKMWHILSGSWWSVIDECCASTLEASPWGRCGGWTERDQSGLTKTSQEAFAQICNRCDKSLKNSSQGMLWKGVFGNYRGGQSYHIK